MNDNNSFTIEQKLGAKSLLLDGLKLSENHTVLIIHQDRFAAAAACIKSVAESLKIVVELRDFTKENFQQMIDSTFLPENLSQLHGVSPSGIALLSEWSEETTTPRLTLLARLAEANTIWRIASMPGINLRELSQCVSNFDQIREISESVFSLLFRSRLAVLETTGPNGQNDELRIPLQKRNYRPIISTGEIAKGSWGNFPSGETFIVPDEFAAAGWVTIRGSLPLRPLSVDEWVRFEVARGRIAFSSISASSGELKRYFERFIFRPNGKVKCKNANTLAELGIGTNPDIKELTGMPIFDEKQLGSVHIAFGRNTQFEGPLESCVHHDLVCTGSCLKLYSTCLDYELITSGQFVKPVSGLLELGERLRSIDFSGRRLGSGNVDVSISDDILFLTAHTQRNQNVLIPLAETEMALLANEIIQYVSQNKLTDFDELVEYFGKKHEMEICDDLIRGLIEFGVFV